MEKHKNQHNTRPKLDIRPPAFDSASFIKKTVTELSIFAKSRSLIPAANLITPISTVSNVERKSNWKPKKGMPQHRSNPLLFSNFKPQSQQTKREYSSGSDSDSPPPIVTKVSRSNVQKDFEIIQHTFNCFEKVQQFKKPKVSSPSLCSLPISHGASYDESAANHVRSRYSTAPISGNSSTNLSSSSEDEFDLNLPPSQRYFQSNSVIPTRILSKGKGTIQQTPSSSSTDSDDPPSRIDWTRLKSNIHYQSQNTKTATDSTNCSNSRVASNKKALKLSDSAAKVSKKSYDAQENYSCTSDSDSDSSESSDNSPVRRYSTRSSSTSFPQKCLKLASSSIYSSSDDDDPPAHSIVKLQTQRTFATKGKRQSLITFTASSSSSESESHTEKPDLGLKHTAYEDLNTRRMLDPDGRVKEELCSDSSESKKSFQDKQLPQGRNLVLIGSLALIGNNQDSSVEEDTLQINTIAKSSEAANICSNHKESNQSSPLVKLEDCNFIPENPLCSKNEGFSKHEIKAFIQTRLKYKFSCPFCSDQFITKTVLFYHMNRKHTKEKPFRCGIDKCRKSFVRRCDLYRHQRSLHPAKSSQVVKVNNMQNMKDQADSDPVPDKFFVSTTQQLYQCRICDKVMKSQRNLNLHVGTHYANEHECDICGKKFSQQCYLKLHKTMHQGRKMFPCPECNDSFLKRVSLINHLRRFHSIGSKKSDKTTSQQGSPEPCKYYTRQRRKMILQELEALRDDDLLKPNTDNILINRTLANESGSSETMVENEA